MPEKMPGFNDYQDFLRKVGHGTIDGVDIFSLKKTNRKNCT